MYQLINVEGKLACIKRIADTAIIPLSAGNTDYQEYLAWLAEGNEPLPADKTTNP